MPNTLVQTQYPDDNQGSWSPSIPAVRKALTWLRKRGKTTTEELVGWDAANGKRLFNWDDTSAAIERRLDQARQFLNSFRGLIDGLRVRAFINVPATEETERAYYSVEHISETPVLRTRVMEDIVKRLRTLASELKMWKLTEHEREAILVQLRREMAE